MNVIEPHHAFTGDFTELSAIMPSGTEENLMPRDEKKIESFVENTGRINNA